MYKDTIGGGQLNSLDEWGKTKITHGELKKNFILDPRLSRL
jgi:hypothetical protein